MYIEINLKQIKDNISIIKKQTKSKIMLMLKAEAYGHGLCEVAMYTDDCVDFFGVAFYEEGKILKDANIKTPILILFADENEIEKSILNNFSISVNNMTELKYVIKKSKECFKRAKIHLSFDTGINRLGFTENEVKTILEIIEINEKNILLEGVYSHFYSTRPSVMRTQFQTFKKIKECFKLYENKCIFHMASSHAIQNTNLFNLDMIRIGILAYGINDNMKLHKLEGINPCMTIHTKVIDIRQIKIGDGVGYSHKYIARADTKIAIAMGGYADGINNSFVNSYAIIKGKKYKIIAVCMDMFMLEIFDDIINVNDEIILLGMDEVERKNIIENDKIKMKFLEKYKQKNYDDSGINICNNYENINIKIAEKNEQSTNKKNIIFTNNEKKNTNVNYEKNSYNSNEYIGEKIIDDLLIDEQKNDNNDICKNCANKSDINEKSNEKNERNLTDCYLKNMNKNSKFKSKNIHNNLEENNSEININNNCKKCIYYLKNNTNNNYENNENRYENDINNSERKVSISALDIAKEQGKIAYEILLGFHGRFKKKFIK